jgi:hypothetical protein
MVRPLLLAMLLISLSSPVLAQTAEPTPNTPPEPMLELPGMETLPVEDSSTKSPTDEALEVLSPEELEALIRDSQRSQTPPAPPAPAPAAVPVPAIPAPAPPIEPPLADPTPPPAAPAPDEPAPAAPADNDATTEPATTDAAVPADETAASDAAEPEIDEDKDPEVDLDEVLLSGWKAGSIMFSNDASDRINRIFYGYLQSGMAKANLKLNKDGEPLSVDALAPAPPPDMPIIYLSSVLYNSPGNWSAWVNGNKITPNQPSQLPGLVVESVGNNTAVLRWKPQMQPIVDNAETPAVQKLDDRDYRVTLRANQAFIPKLLKVLEGRAITPEIRELIAPAATAAGTEAVPPGFDGLPATGTEKDIEAMNKLMNNYQSVLGVMGGSTGDEQPQNTNPVDNIPATERPAPLSDPAPPGSPVSP